MGNEGIDYNSFESDLYLSPQKYIVNEYNSNLNKFISDEKYLNQL